MTGRHTGMGGRLEGKWAGHALAALGAAGTGMKPRTPQWCSAILTAAFALGGCASAPMEELTKARATVALASQSSHGAAEPARAEAKLALGRRLINSRAYGPARWAVEQAQVDAELSLAKSAAEDAIRRAAMSGSSQTPARPIAGNAFGYRR